MSQPHTLTVHDARLVDGPLEEEDWLGQGEGSAFVSRPWDLVVLTSDEAGLNGLKAKVEQLVDRGFHAIALSLDGVEELADANAAATSVLQAARHVAQFVGWFRVVADDDVREALSERLPADAGEVLEFVGGRDAVLEAFRQREVAPSDTGEVEDPNDWGWGSDDATGEEGGDDGLPQVDVAELVVQSDEVAQLAEQVRGILERGKRYVTLRLHFDRRMESEDVGALIEVRDLLAGAGGQLVLAALPLEFLQWLRLLDEDRHFAITETADEAETAHRRHAAGLVEAPPAPDAPAFAIASRDEGRVLVRPREEIHHAVASPSRVATRHLVVPEGDALRGLAGRVGDLAAEGAEAVILDLSAFEAVQGERFDPVAVAASAAEARGLRFLVAGVSREVKALLQILALDPELLLPDVDAALVELARRIHDAAPFSELHVDLTREELVPGDRDSDVLAIATESDVARLDGDGGGGGAVGDADAGGGEDAAAEQIAGLREELARERASLEGVREELAQVRAARRQAEARTDELRRQLDEARAAATRAEAEAEQARTGQASAEERADAAAGELAEARAEARRAEEQVEELRRELEETRRERDEARAQLEAAPAAGAAAEERVEALRGELEEARRERDEARAQLESAPAGAAAAGDADADADADADGRVARLEAEKARVLAEAEQEIRRLAEERRVLREELESAGEMIERLGKELELS